MICPNRETVRTVLFVLFVLLACSIVFLIAVPLKAQKPPLCSIMAVEWTSHEAFHLSFGCGVITETEVVLGHTLLAGGVAETAIEIFKGDVTSIMGLAPTQAYPKITFVQRYDNWNDSVEAFKATDNSVVRIHELLLPVMEFLTLRDLSVYDIQAMEKLDAAILRAEQARREVEELEKRLKDLRSDLKAGR